MHIIKKLKLKNCIDKIRYRYTFDSLLTELYLQSLYKNKIKFNRFSNIVKGAKDHFVVMVDSYRLSGVIDSKELIVTFIKTDDNIHKELIKQFDVFIEQQ